MTSTVWNRRTIIRLAGVGGLAVAGLGGATAAASTRTFNLSGEARMLYTGVRLASVTVQQSFTFEPSDGRLFVAQLLSGSPAVAGDLHISELDQRGRLLGSMKLLGHGHAVSFSTQPFRGGTYLWTEGEANGNGYGTVLKRFAWQPGVTLERDDPRAARFRPVPEALETTCDIDHRAGRIAVRYHTSAGKRIAIMRLVDVIAGGEPVRLADFPQPPGFGTFQGYALHGDQLYALEGNSYSDSNPYPGNTYLSRIDCSTGERVERVHNTTGDDLVFREPEGLAIGYTRTGQPRLYLGFASGVTGDRRSNLFFLSR